MQQHALDSLTACDKTLEEFNTKLQGLRTTKDGKSIVADMKKQFSLTFKKDDIEKLRR